MVYLLYRIKALSIWKEVFMSEKRKDSEGRVLRTGENQRKDGTYMYRYTDVLAKRQCIYNKDLNNLRNKEKEIQKDIEDGIDCRGNQITFIELYDMFIENKQNIRESTKLSFYGKRHHIVESKIGYKKISNITMYDVNIILSELKQKGLKSSTIKLIVGSYRLAFDFAVQINFIRKNPFPRYLTIDDNHISDNHKKREALTVEQENRFLALVKEDNYYSYYYDIIKLILLTGVRIGEAIGLTWDDVDFKNKKLIINHQIMLRTDASHYITTTKTSSGHREIYLYDELYLFLKNLKNKNADKKSGYYFRRISQLYFFRQK